MKSSKSFHDKFHNYGQRETYPNLLIKGLPFIVTLLIITILSFFFLYSPNPLSIIPNQDLEIIQKQSQNDEYHHAKTFVPNQEHDTIEEHQHVSPSKLHKEKKTCDIFKGHWIRGLRGSSYYTNSSCPTIPDSKNCFKHGRMDSDFLNWKWKPEKCDLPMFDPKIFLNIVRGKKMAFIGDSVARNHMDSLLCLLSQEETPIDIYKDSEDKFRTYHFPKNGFTLMILWSRFLIEGEERIVNGTGSGTFDLQMDKVDEDWAKVIPELDYAIISGGHWFFRLMFLHEAGKLLGCIYCSEKNVKNYDIDFPLRLAFKTSLKYINNCKDCRKGKLFTIMRTFAPAHFENGIWNTGGYCNRTGPINEGEIDLNRFELNLRNIQMEEFKEVKNNNRGKTRFEILDVTNAMMMRPDGHPGEHWGNKWMKGYNDCTHWCLPGAIDVWNEFFLAVLQREDDKQRRR
ncbi:unnamed protein product [Lathyrus sativus]|nr:unnamed protein product [Lathyrus sativus]